MSSAAAWWQRVLRSWEAFLGILKLDDGRAFYESLVDEPWRLKLVRLIVSPASRIVFVDLVRGAGKTTMAGGLAVLWLFILRNVDLFVIGVDKLQAAILFEAAVEFIRRTPRLLEQVDIQPSRQRILNRRNGSKLEVLSAEAPANYGYGRRRFVVLFDEFAHQRDRSVLDPWTTALSKAPGSKVVVLTNAGPDRSGFAWELRERCRLSTDPALAFFSGEEIPGGRPKSLTQAEWDFQKSINPPAIFAQYFEGVWGLGGGTRVFLPEQIDAVIDPDLDASALQFAEDRNYFGGLDLGWTNDRSTCAIVHKERETIVVDNLTTWFGSRESPISFEAVFAHLSRMHRMVPRLRRVYTDPWQAGMLLERAAHAGIRGVEQFTFTAKSRQMLSQWLYQAVSSRNIRIPDHALLVEELRQLRMVSMPGGGWKFDHPPNGFDDHVMALAMAIGAALPDHGNAITSDPAMDHEIQKLLEEVTDPRKFGFQRPSRLTLTDGSPGRGHPNLRAECRMLQLLVRADRMSREEAEMLLGEIRKELWKAPDAHAWLFNDDHATNTFYGGSIRSLIDHGFESEAKSEGGA